MKTCTFPMEITKEGAQSLRRKMPNAEFYLTEATVIYLWLLPAKLAARLPELVSKLGRVGCSHLFNLECRSKLLTDYSSGEQ